MPITGEAPVLDSVLTVLPLNTCVPEELVMPVTAPVPVTLDTVLPLIVPAELKLTFRTVIAELPPAMLLNVLFVIDFAGNGAPPSAERQNCSVVAPVTVTFEKL